MVGFGWIELLSILFVFGFLLIARRLLRNVSKLEAWIASWREGRAFHYDSAVSDEKKRRSWVPLPFALTVAVAATVSPFVPVVLMSAGYDAYPLVRLLNAGLIAIALILILGGVFLHFTPGTSRRLKYELLVGGFSITALSLCGRVAGIILESGTVWTGVAYRQAVPNALQLTLVLSLWALTLLLLLVFGALTYLWLWRTPGAVEDERPTPLMRRTYRRLMARGYGLALMGFSGLIQPLLMVYLVLRYGLVERMAQNPIVYLRSFHHSEGPTAFGKIVMRVAPRYGVVIALAHGLQPESAFQAQTRLTERPKLSRVSDEIWQEWVERELARCSAVIIDGTGGTEGVAWELDRALTLVERHRIIVLQQEGTGSDLDPGIWCLKYELGDQQEKAARSALDDQLGDVVFLPSHAHSSISA
jgi:hypothetical protein